MIMDRSESESASFAYNPEGMNNSYTEANNDAINNQIKF